MKLLKENAAEGMLENFIKYESNVTKIVCLMLAALYVKDLGIRIFVEGQRSLSLIIFVQASLILLYFLVSRFQHKYQDSEKPEISSGYKVFRIVEVTLCALFISTLFYSEYFYFVPILPIAFECIKSGYRKARPYLLLGLISQLVTQALASLYLKHVVFESVSILRQSIIITCMYVLYTGFIYICGIVHKEYVQSEAENNILIDRLGDKYIQLEQAKKEIQEHYDKVRETNKKLEETNEKLTASIAEFYTLQQISQAITSIFNMNELLKFVNDIIMGVMGALHSTIALCYGPYNKLKVQVSSIYDRKELAIVSDYINTDVLKPCTTEGKSMIDNNVNPECYPFTIGRNIKSLICVPFLAKGNPLGVVLIEHSFKDAFNSENVRLLEIICQQVSIAIENARLYQQMHDLATMDGLTGAYNRLYFQDKILEEFNRAKEEEYELSLIIFDIDHFKKFNDTYGHLFGDKVLKSISAYIQRTLRKEDIFARFGGEEFVILMPHTSLQQAVEKAEEIRKGIASLTITDRVVEASVNISLGVSSIPHTANNPNELVRTADDALYEAKESGRNNVKVAKPVN